MGFDLIPEEFPPMGAEFIKPYMEFEYNHELIRIENLRGGHNGRNAAVAACNAHPPTFDELSGRWVVPIVNNVIDIDVTNQDDRMTITSNARRLEANSPLFKLKIQSNTRSKYQSVGLLYSATTDKSKKPSFPVDCTFYMFIRARMGDGWSVINTKPFRLTAKQLLTWPPPKDTTYVNEDTIELYPEWIPLVHRVMKPIVRILPGDKTILTNVFQERGPVNNKKSLSSQRVMEYISKVRRYYFPTDSKK